MIFSGFYSQQQCTECEHTKGRTTPTSLLFFVALMALGTRLLMPVVADLFGAHWWVFVALSACELIVIVTAMILLVIVRDTLQGPLESCPRRHDVDLVEPNRRLRFTWPLRGEDTTVDIRLTERDGNTVLAVWHHNVRGIPRLESGCYSVDDLWFLWLENLRRYIDGRPVARADFQTDKTGDLSLSVDIDGSTDAVWDALTKPDQLNRYFSSNATVEPSVGGVWIDWGEGEGALRVLEIERGKKLSLGWEIEGTPTVVTWTLEESGGKTRLTLAHSGFATDRHSDAEWGGWLNYLGLIRSLVEFGLDWLPPVKEITQHVALYYAAVIWAQQDELLGEEEWGES